MTKIQKTSMILLSIYPWLWIYRSPIPLFNWGDFAFLLLIIVSLVKGAKFSLLQSKEYTNYWCWCAVSLLITSTSFKITYLVPGGINFFIFSIILWFVINTMDIEYLKKCLRVFFIFCAVIFLLQYIMFQVSGQSFSALVPFLSLIDEIDTKDLMETQLEKDRPSSLFREPAHLAQFLCVFLPVELYTGKEKNILCSPLAFLSIVILLLLRSGNGMLLLSIVIIFKLLFYFKIATISKKVIVTLAVIPLLTFGTIQFLASEVGVMLIERSSEISSTVTTATSGYLRVIRGYEIFDALPTINKFIGAAEETVLQHEGNSAAQFLTGDLQNDLYFNGIQTILIYKGYIGLSLFAFMLFKLVRKNEMVSVALLITFVCVSFIGSTYLSHTMLCALAISIYYRLNLSRKRNEI